MGTFGPPKNHKATGERSQAHIMAKLLDVGYNVLTPFGDNARYDLVDGESTMATTLNLTHAAHIITRGPEGQVTEKEIIGDRPIFLQSIVRKQRASILFRSNMLVLQQ